MGAHVILKQMEVGRMAVFAYLVGCEKTKEALVIDPAGDEDRILQEANKKGSENKIHCQHSCPCGPGDIDLTFG